MTQKDPARIVHKPKKLTDEEYSVMLNSLIICEGKKEDKLNRLKEEDLFREGFEDGFRYAMGWEQRKKDL